MVSQTLQTHSYLKFIALPGPSAWVLPPPPPISSGAAPSLPLGLYSNTTSSVRPGLITQF